jgi:hypothetical protein
MVIQFAQRQMIARVLPSAYLEDLCQKNGDVTGLDAAMVIPPSLYLLLVQRNARSDLYRPLLAERYICVCIRTALVAYGNGTKVQVLAFEGGVA